MTSCFSFKPISLPGGERAGKRADQPGRMETDLMKCALGDGAEPRGDFDPERRKRPAFRAPLARCRAPTASTVGKHARRRMDDAAAMGVVEVEAVDQDAVDQSGVAQRQPRRHADDGEIAGAGEAGHRRHRAVRKSHSRSRQARCRPHRVSDAWRAPSPPPGLPPLRTRRRSARAPPISAGRRSILGCGALRTVTGAFMRSSLARAFDGPALIFVRTNLRPADGACQCPRMLQPRSGRSEIE